MPKPKVKTPAQMKMEMAVDRARNVLPQAEREANRAKFLEGSKISDRIYRGNTEDIISYDKNKLGSNPDTAHQTSQLGFFLTKSPDEASAYAGREEGANVQPLHAAIKNPYETTWENIREVDGYELQQKLKSLGYDGVVIRDAGMPDNYVAFEPTQVKSAIGNEGTYDITNPDITKAHGGAVHMAGGGMKTKGSSPTIITRSGISELAEYIKNREGTYGSRRVQRAADEIPKLGELYSQDALREVFSGDNARALMTMNPADFEKYARPLQPNPTTKVGGDKDKYDMSTEDYVKHLQTVGGFDSVPYLVVNKGVVGEVQLPWITGHEGRHRSRSLADRGITSSLVEFQPRAELREPFPRRSQAEYIDAIRKEMALTDNKVKPEQYWDDVAQQEIKRRMVKLPDLYAEGGAVKMQDGGNPQDVIDQAVMDQIRYELANQPKLKPTTDVDEQIKNAQLMASPERTSLDAGDAITSPEMYEQNKDLFSVNRKPASQAYTQFGVPLIDESGKPVPFPKTMYDIENAEIDKQLERGIKPKWMSDADFIKYQAEMRGYNTNPKTIGDFGQNALAALMGSTFLGGSLKALGAIDQAAQDVIGSSYGLDPTMGMVGKVGEFHRVPRGLRAFKEGVTRDVGQFSNDVFNAQRGITPGFPTLGSEFSRAFVTPKPTTYELLSGLEPSMLPSSAAKIFAGSKSKTADLAMRDIAQARLIAGEDPAIVWKETGWTAPPYGGEMRYEIPDTGLSGKKITEAVSKKFNEFGKNKFDLDMAYTIKVNLDRGNTIDEVLAKLPTPPSPEALKLALDDTITEFDIFKKIKAAEGKAIETAVKTRGKLGSFVEHPEFFAAYPDMANLIKFETMGKRDIKTSAGAFNAHDKKLTLSPHLDKGRESVLAHELQHAVQHREDTAPGGSPSGVKASPEQFDPITAGELQALQDRIINDTGRLGELHRKRESGRISILERQELTGLTQALPEYSNYIQARKDFLSQGTPTELYRRLAGEAEARLTQYRLGLTPEQRLAQYPYEPDYFKTATGYSLDDIINNIVREGSSISSKSEEPSVPKMKAELREKVLAPANPQGFYSATEAAALNLQRKSGSGQAFLNDLLKQENVRPDEISAMGLDTFLKDKKNITAAEVQDFIAKNKIQLGETTYGVAPKLTPEQKERLAYLVKENNKTPLGAIDDILGEGTYEELIRLENIRDKSSVDSLYRQQKKLELGAHEARRAGDKAMSDRLFTQANHMNARAEALDLQGAGIERPSKFGQYALPGGENYREVVITLPDQPKNALAEYAKYRDELYAKYGKAHYQVEATPQELEKLSALSEATSVVHPQYRSSHWDDPNPLAHLRMSDRVTDGKKTLLVDEVQSDWHQAGREQGYASQVGKKVSDEEHKIALNLQQRQRNGDALSDTEQSQLTDILDRHMASLPGMKVPDAPFKDDWYQLALKRAIKEAIDNGYDRVAITPAKKQIDRYTDAIRANVDHIEYEPYVNDAGEKRYAISGIKNGKEVVQQEELTEKQLKELVGKDIASKITSGSGESLAKERPLRPDWMRLSGDDLSIGGEGFKTYYDEVYPGYLKKFGKKYGAKVGKTTVDADGVAEPLHYMEITPAMREAFKTGIHMKRGGKVSFANDIDAMRLELSKG